MAEKMKISELKSYLIADIAKNKKKGLFGLFRLGHSTPSCNAVYLIRMAQFFNSRRPSFICRHYTNKLVRRYGIFINASTKIGKGLFIPHPTGIVIGKACSLGDRCSIFQQVTIGGGNMGDSIKANQPNIGDDCIFFAGSKILGSIKVENGTVVGANSVLKQDTVKNGVYAGCPAKFIKENNK